MRDTSRNQRNRKRLTVLVPFLLAAAYLAVAPFSVTDGGGSWLDSDYGLLTNNGTRILSGEMLYRDVWSMYGPAEDHTIAFLYSIFGESLRTLRTSLAVLGAITACLIFFFALATTSLSYALILSAFIFLLGPLCVNYPYPSWFCAPLGLSMIWLQHLGWKKRSLGYYVLAGVVAGAIFSFKQNWGMFALMALFIMQSFAALINEDDGRNAAGVAIEAYLLHALWFMFPAMSLILIAKHFSTANFTLFCLPTMLASLSGVMMLLRRNREKRRVYGFLFPAAAATTGFAVVVLPWIVFFLIKLGTKGFYDCLIRSPRIFVALFYYPLREMSLNSLMLILLVAAQGVMILRGRTPEFFRRVLVLSWCGFSLFLMKDMCSLIKDGILTTQISMYDDRAFGIACYLPLAVHIGSGLLFLKDLMDTGPKDRNRLHLLLSLWIYSVATFHALYPLIEIYHLIWIMPPVVLLGAVFISRTIEFWTANSAFWRKALAYCLALPVPIFFAAFFGLPIFRYFVTVNFHPFRTQVTEFALIGTPRGGVLMPKQRAGSINATVNFIQTHTGSDEFLFDMTGSFFNFLADRRCPTRWGIFYRDLLSPDDVRQIAGDLDLRKPPVMVNSTWAEWTFYNFYRGLYDHFYADYRPAGTFLEYQVMLRRVTAGEKRP